MPRALPPTSAQYGLIVALFAVLLWGLLVPGGDARAGALAAQAAGTPVAQATPRPAPPASAAPPAPAAPPPSAPVQTTPTVLAVASPVAVSPGGGGTAVAGTAVIPRLPGTRVPTPTPTRTPTGSVSAAVARDLSPLAFTLTGRTQSAQTTLVVAVSDTAPATWQPGWTLSLSVDRFRVAGNPARALPADAITLLGVTVTCADDADCTAPENTIAYPLTMPDGGAVPIYAAAPGSGSGRFTIMPTFAVKVPGNAYAGSYTTAIAVDIGR